jgi:hypothetical protein
VIATLGEKLFEKNSNNSKTAPTYTTDQINQMQEIVNFVEKNDWTQSMVEAFIETLPKCMAQYEHYKQTDSPIKAAVLAMLIVQGTKSTVNLWSAYEKCSNELAEFNRSEKYLENLRNKRVVDFVKLSQFLMYT